MIDYQTLNTLQLRFKKKYNLHHWIVKLYFCYIRTTINKKEHQSSFYKAFDSNKETNSLEAFKDICRTGFICLEINFFFFDSEHN